MPTAPTLAPAALLADVPRGNTQKHVNRTVLAYLLGLGALQRPGLRWLDLPCGAGELLEQVGRLFPGARRWGADVRAAAPPAPVRYEPTDLSQDFPFANGPAFDVITSISGIMCFGNTAQFIGRCAARLAPGGCSTSHARPKLIECGSAISRICPWPTATGSIAVPSRTCARSRG